MRLEKVNAIQNNIIQPLNNRIAASKKEIAEFRQ